MMEMVAKFRDRYPGVQFALFDGDGDSLRERLDQELKTLSPWWNQSKPLSTITCACRYVKNGGSS